MRFAKDGSGTAGGVGSTGVGGAVEVSVSFTPLNHDLPLI